jgi:uncharacterized protein YndB with AHSA1/START domain
LSELPEYLLARHFNAPRELVWRAWTDPGFISRWYGPGVETTIHQFDLEPGGSWLNEMKWGENSDFSKMVFQQVIPSEKLVWLHSSTDSEWNITASQMMADWPRTLLTTATFTETGSKTNVRLTMVPVDGTDAEITCFANAMSGMDKGWGSGYSIMDEILKELGANS